MKQILTILLIAGTLAACKKSSNTEVAQITPTAFFKITNQESALTVREGNLLDFVNDSKDAVSYAWDFGDGNISTEKVPTTFFFPSCGSEKKITLTVTSKTGQTATFTNSYSVMCSGKVSPNATGGHLPLSGAISHN